MPKKTLTLEQHRRLAECLTQAHALLDEVRLHAGNASGVYAEEAADRARKAIKSLSATSAALWCEASLTIKTADANAIHRPADLL